jgi:hypothetical protein
MPEHAKIVSKRPLVAMSAFHPKQTSAVAFFSIGNFQAWFAR